MESRQPRHLIAILLLGSFGLLNPSLIAQPGTFDGDKPIVSYDSQYAQEFNPTAGWDRFEFYGQWNTLLQRVFNASDISTGALQFHWIEKRVLCSKKNYIQPYLFEANYDYSNGSNRAGIVIRIESLSEIIQEPDSDPGFNSEGIAFYPTEDGASMIVQFSGVYKGYQGGTEFTRIHVPKPVGVNSLRERGTLRIEDFGSSLYVYYNDAPYIRIELEDPSDGLHTAGSVYDADLELMGSFTGMEVEESGFVAIAQRDALLRLYSVNINFNDTDVVTNPADTILFESPYRDLYADTWVATDALGREMPTYQEVGPLKKDKRRDVGIFYVTWHTQGHHTNFQSPFSADVTKILAADPSARFDAFHPLWDYGAYSYHWAEPEMGYFLSQDEYVIRKDMALLSNAGVDVLILDVTNAVRYWDEWEVLFQTMEKIKAEGNKVPQFCFWAFNGPVISVVQDLYDWFYKTERYKELWYYWDDKPLLLYNTNPNVDANGGGVLNPNPNYDPDALSNPDNPHYGDPDYTEENYTDYTQEVKDFFTKRNMWWGYYEWNGERYVGTEDNWSFGYELQHEQVKSMNPDDLVAPHQGIKEQAAVCPAQHPSSLVGKSWRRETGEPALDEYDLPEPAFVPWLGEKVENPEGYGIYFQDRWDEAIQSDPDFLYINDWNEWTAGKFHPESGSYSFMRRSSPYYFVDQYNSEFNRGIQPMKGDYTDNYYMQMAQNIRRYKGVRPLDIHAVNSQISVDQKFSDWEQVANEYRDAIGDTRHRRHNGYGGLEYTNATGRNDIMAAKVAYNKDSLYFYVKTVYDLTPSGDPNWMLLFLDVDRNRTTGWEGYDFMINQEVNSSTETTLKQWTGLKWEDGIALPLAISGGEMEIGVPREALMLEEEVPEFYFKWADNPQHLDDISAFFTHGESAPDRRFNYKHSISELALTGQFPFKELTIPGTIDFEDFDEGSAGLAYADAVIGNSGGAYRTEQSVDISARDGSGYFVTDVFSNEWLEFTVEVKAIGIFSLTINYAADSTDQQISLLMNNKMLVDQLELPKTGSHQEWASLQMDVTLNAGVQVLKVLVGQASGGLHLDHMVFAEKSIVSPGTGTGLLRTLYNGKAGGRGWFTDSLCSGVDPLLDHEWAEGESPGCEANTTYWNARWEGYLEPLFSEEYIISLTVNDKVKVWVEGELLLDAWTGTIPNQTHSLNIQMSAGEKIPIQIDYANASGGGHIKMEWESTTQQKEIIPQNQLYPKQLTGVHDNTPVTTPLLYPNPASQRVFLETRESTSVEIYGVGGEKVYESKAASAQFDIDVSQWNPGLYLVKIKGPNQVYSKKLLVK